MRGPCEAGQAVSATRTEVLQACAASLGMTRVLGAGHVAQSPLLWGEPPGRPPARPSAGRARAQTGWLVTVASLGDSRAALDTGAAVVPLSVDHRVATHKGERRRLDALGVQIAPIDVSGARGALARGVRADRPGTRWNARRVRRAHAVFHSGSANLQIPCSASVLQAAALEAWDPPLLSSSLGQAGSPGQADLGVCAG